MLKIARYIPFLILLFLLPCHAYAKSTVANLPPEQVGFTGKLNNIDPSVFLSANDFTDLQNFRYYPNGIGTRSGMTEWSTDTEGDEVVDIIPFEHENDGLIVLAVGNDPSTGLTYYQVEDQAFGSTALWQTSATTEYPVTHAVVRDTLTVADETGVSQWSGTSAYPTAILVGDTDKTDWVYSGASEHVAEGDTFYVGFDKPFDAIQPDENSGTWDTSFSSSVTPELIGGKYRYWAECTCTTGGSFFQNPKIKTTPNPIRPMWDGESWQYAGYAVFQKTGTSEYADYSLLVADSSEETYMDVGEWESGGTVVFGFFNKVRNVRVRLPEDYKNDTGSVLSLYYWNGTWTAISGTTSDGTSHNDAAFAQTGLLNLPQLTDWETRTYGESDLSLYPLLLKTSATIDDYVRIYSVLGIPEVDDPNDDGYKSCVGYRDRVFLFNGTDLNRVLMSAYRQPNVFVGEDAFSEVYDFRIGRKERTLAAVPLENGLFWCKKTENYFVTGHNPATIAESVVKLENTVPFVAPESIVLVEGEQGKFVIGQAANGVYALDANGTNPILSKDIAAYWTEGNSLKIPNTWLDQSRGAWDRHENEYSLLIASGSGVTQFNVRLVYDLESGRWTTFEVNDNVELASIASLTNEDNEYLRLGGAYNGYVYELERTGDDAGYDIISDFTRAPYTLSGGVNPNEIRGRNVAGEQELRAIAFNYRLPDDTAITGCSLYITSGIESTETTNQEGFNLTDEGWRASALDPSWNKKGDYHIIRFRVPGRIEFYRQILWSREAPWEISMSLDFLIDEHGNLLIGNDYLLRS
jgi:hypothetical protein